jgi:Protein of unknown function (DUF2800)
MVAHSKIGPSSLGRLLACPGSHRLSATKPPGASSSYAAEGTVAHALIEERLTGTVLVETSLGDMVVEEGHQIVVDEDMLEGVDKMVRFCEAVAKGADRVWVEARVDMGRLWDPDPAPEPFFGTCDFGAYHAKTDTLYVVDYKHGRLPVSAETPQTRAYALGLVYALGRVPANVIMTIVQPRGQDHQPVKASVLTGLDLMMWAGEVLRPGLDALYGSAPPLTTGDHCRFCPAKVDCPALYELARQAARTDFTHVPPDPMTFSDADLAHVLNNAEVIAQWIEAVRAEVSGRIEKGRAVPGWKLVPKRAMRKWADEKAVASLLEGVPQVFTTKLKSPAQVEKLAGDEYGDLVARGLVDATSSGTTLVPDVDPRIAVAGRSGRDEFDMIGGDDDDDDKAAVDRFTAA